MTRPPKRRKPPKGGAIQIGSEKESEFLAGKFFDMPLPKSERYLLKYFRSDLEKQFLRYLLWIGDTTRFTEHTGYHCQPRWLRILKERYDKIVALRKWAKAQGTEEGIGLLSRIERGKLTFKQFYLGASTPDKGEKHETTGDPGTGGRTGGSTVAGAADADERS